MDFEAHLKKDIQAAQEAVDALQGDDTKLAEALYELAIRHKRLYEETRAMDSLEDAIKACKKALNKPWRNDSTGSVYNYEIGELLSYRYHRTERRIDLDEAIKRKTIATLFAPENDTNRAKYFSGLGDSLGDKYNRLGTSEYLKLAIENARESVKIASSDDPRRGLFFIRLGLLLGLKFSETKKLTDLDEAIEYGWEGVEATDKDDQNLASRYDALGTLHHARFGESEQLADIEKAIELGWEAVYSTGETDPVRPTYEFNLGLHFKGKYLTTREVSDLNSAIDYFQPAAYNHPVPIRRILAGQEVFRCYVLGGSWDGAYQAAKETMRVISKVSLRPIEIADKEYILSQLAGIASDAAAVAIRADQGASNALSFLEQGRGVLAASLEQTRTAMVELKGISPGTASLLDELEPPIPSSPFDGNPWTSWQQRERRYVAGARLDKIIDMFGEWSASEDFLNPLSDIELHEVATYGPVVIVNVSQYSCDAILIEADQIRSLPLHYLKVDGIKEKARQGPLARVEVLEWLWEVVANPVLTALGFTQPPEDTWPRIWWIPTGPLSEFPIHAAGYHRKHAGETVLDRVVSSYSSSLRAIIQARNRPSSQLASTKALLVAMEDTPANLALPFAKKEVEMVHNLCESMRLDPIEPGRYKEDIIPQLPQCQVFHFAGHGSTDGQHPSSSHLLLENKTGSEPTAAQLTVADLLEMNLDKQAPFLAYLSACGTGQMKDGRLVDESIHLVSAFQLAGFRHVIGTLWGVKDEPCLDIARKFYECIAYYGLTDEAVAYGLHEATTQLRDIWLELSTKRRARRSRLVETPSETHSSSSDGGGLAEEGISREAFSRAKNTTTALHWVPYVHFGV